MVDFVKTDGQLQEKLEKFEKLLAQIEQNGRANPEEKFYVWRSDLDGKLITVRIRCNIRSVGDIDNVNQQFSVKLWFSACWFEPLLRGKSRDEIDWESTWDPRITFENALNVNQISRKHYLTYIPEESPDPEVKLSVHLEGTFKEIMELEDFPFDYQELNIVIGTDWGARDVVFKKDMRIKDSINLFNFMGNQSYNLQPHLIATSKELEKDASGSHKKYNCHILTFHVSRRMGYYFWNVFFVTGVIMLLTFCSLAVPPDEPGDRLGVTVTLLLTSVAFKYAVSQGLPTISYLTLLDIYVITCLVLQSIFLVQNSVAAIVSDGRKFDLYSGMTLAAAVILFHIIFILIVAMKIHKRNYIMSQYTNYYNQLCTEINKEYERKKREESKAPTKLYENTEQQIPNGVVNGQEFHIKANDISQPLRLIPHSQDDNVIKSHQNDVNSHQNDVNSHQKDANSHQNDVKSHQNDVKSHQNDVKSHQNDVNSHQKDVNSHQNDMKSHQNGVKAKVQPHKLERRTSKPVAAAGAVVEVMSDSEDGSFSYQPLYPTPPPRPKKPKDKSKHFEALRDYKDPNGNPEVLSFKAGELLIANMLKVQPNGWVKAENSRGQSGIVPSAYLKPSPKRMPRVETH